MNTKFQMKRNIYADYCFCLLYNIDFCSAIWVLYMVYQGIPLWQIGILEGIYHVTSFICEVPSGAVADLIGRKNSMIAGRIFGILTAVIQLLFANFWGFAVGFICSALSHNLNSGSEEALVYDSLKVIGEEESYIQINSRLNIVIEIAQALATFLGGILAEYSFFWCYVSAAGSALVSLIPTVFMQEPPIHGGEKREVPSWREHFWKSGKVIKENPEVIGILIYYPAVETFYAVTFFYGQEFFSQAGFDKIAISLIMLVNGIFCCLGSLCSERILHRFGKHTKYLASLMMGGCIILFSRYVPILSIAVFAWMGFCMSCLYPIQSAALNALIPSEQRATIISVDSMCFSIGMIVVFPVCGLIASKWNLHVTFLLLGILQILMTGILKGQSRDFLQS